MVPKGVAVSRIRTLAADPRFMAKIEVAPSGCWVWTGAKRKGYGDVRREGRTWGAHRWAYAVETGEPPEGTELRHLCKNRACVRPAHLEVVARFEGLRRDGAQGRWQLAKTHCPQGHPYDEENTVRRQGRRFCRTCSREWAARNRARSAGVAR